jgi:hypothetical protein
MYAHKYNKIIYDGYVWSKKFEGHKTEHFLYKQCQHFVVYYKILYTLYRKHKACCSTSLKMDSVVFLTLLSSLKVQFNRLFYVILTEPV